MGESGRAAKGEQSGWQQRRSQAVNPSILLSNYGLSKEKNWS